MITIKKLFQIKIISFHLEKYSIKSRIPTTFGFLLVAKTFPQQTNRSFFPRRTMGCDRQAMSRLLSSQ